LVRYTAAWFRDIGTDPRTLGGCVLWHASAMAGIATVSGLGPLDALACWALYWCVPFFLVLPILRFIAEAEEHVYAGATTIGAATVSNLGWLHRWMFHPHGDGYHALHHLRPAIPHHRLAIAHRRLLTVAAESYGAGLRVRMQLLGPAVPHTSTYQERSDP
jgi:fatty acid desaturase